MFRELFAQLDEERALERAAREEERAFQAHKRSLPSRVRLPAWLLEADASVKKFDSNLGQVHADSKSRALQARSPCNDAVYSLGTGLQSTVGQQDGASKSGNA